MPQLLGHIGSRRRVRVERKRPANPLLNGYLLQRMSPVVGGSIGHGLVLMHPFDDFEPDGYVVFRDQDVVSVRSGAYERLWDTMLRGEGLLAGLDAVIPIELTGLQAAIRSAASCYKYLIVHCEDEHHAVQGFYLGEPVSVTDDTIQMRCLSPMARWEDEAATIRVEDITMIEFDSPYIRRFTKYIGA